MLAKDGIKKCSTCNQIRRVEEYYRNRTTKDGYSATCIFCAYKYREEHRKTPIKRFYTGASLRRKFKRNCWSLKHYKEQVEKQSPILCSIKGCGKPGTCMDHNHKNKKPRGFLCNSCNSALGFVYDNIDILHGLIEYLNRWDGTPAG
jgi:Recombination endonuclease VII